MEKISISFNCRIHRLIDNGFVALDKEEYLIKLIDSKSIHLFNKGDNIQITIENAETAGKESINDGYSVIYCILKNFLSNGIQFDDLNKEKSSFWNARGLITHKRFAEADYFEKNEILRIMIMRA